MFNTEQLNIIRYCAEECERQASGEVSVYGGGCSMHGMKQLEFISPIDLDFILLVLC